VWRHGFSRKIAHVICLVLSLKGVGEIDMSLFVDQLLLKLSDPTQLLQLLAPADDTTHAHLRTLLSVVYSLEFITIHDIRNIAVRNTEIQRLLLATHRTVGTWTQTGATSTRTQVAYEGSDKLEPLWLDVSAEVSLKLLLEIDRGEVETLLTQSVDNFSTLDEFRSHFNGLDLNALMTKLGITTIDELRTRFKHLSTGVQLRKPGTFDPNDPANLYDYTDNVLILIRETIDIALTLHDVKLARTLLERSLAYQTEVNGNEVLTPYAPIVVFPQAALNGLPFQVNILQTFFASQGVLALFMTP
jgi:hypothetical protein